MSSLRYRFERLVLAALWRLLRSDSTSYDWKERWRTQGVRYLDDAVDDFATARAAEAMKANHRDELEYREQPCIEPAVSED